MFFAHALTAGLPVTPSVAEVYADHRHYLWVTLHRLGVREADLPDALQDVLVVVHRRIATFNHSCKLTTWLFGICLRVGAAYRRKAHIRRESLAHEAALGDAALHAAAASSTPRNPAVALDARRRLEQVLDGLKLEHRIVFVMFEIEGLATADIAEQLGIPLGTVHSRLHKGRRAFRAGLSRLEAGDRFEAGDRLEASSRGGSP